MKKEPLKIFPRDIPDVSTFEQMLEALEDLYFGIQSEKTLEEGEFIDFNEANEKFLKY